LNLSAYEIALIGVGSSILGSCITALLTYWFSKLISKRQFIQSKELAHAAVFEQMFLIAAKEFKDIWLPVYNLISKKFYEIEIINIRSQPPNSAFDIATKFTKYFNKEGKNPISDKDLYLSATIFRRYLPDYRLKDFDLACDALFGIQEKDEAPRHLVYCYYDRKLPKEEQKRKEIKARKDLLENIDNLLKFSEKDKP
jgi:hypothetical protein